ncbi:MAG: helix-turn-helix transcriptional regulator [Hespellia sp.]|jgi:AraC-like DNA-binding protein|nr:helix-turn-helix transcriptional regulator [Hespellia sp.]
MIFFETHNLNTHSPYTMYPCDDLNWGLHFHRAYECIFVENGLIECVIGHNDYRFYQGESAFIMPDQLHSITTPRHSRIIILLFQPELIADFDAAHKDKVPTDNKFRFNTDNLWEQTRNIYSLKSLLYAICGTFTVQNTFIKKELASQDILIHNLIAYINDHYTEQCSLKDVAHCCGCDYYYASKFFVKATRMGFSDYVNQLRINKACYLIRSTDDNLLTISDNCGFHSLRSFNRNFLKYCGCTPSEYRENGG